MKRNLWRRLKEYLSGGKKVPAKPDDWEQDRLASEIQKRYRWKQTGQEKPALIHLRRLPAEIREEKKESSSVFERLIVKKYEKEITTRLDRRILAVESGEKELKLSLKRAQLRIEKLERWVNDAVREAPRTLRSLKLHTEREIRTVRTEYTEGFIKEIRLLEHIKQEVRYKEVVQEEFRSHLIRQKIIREEQDGRKEDTVAPVPVRTVLNELEREKEIVRVVKEQFQEETKRFSDRLYRRLERELLRERKRRGI